MKALPPNYISRKLEKYEEGYLINFFTDIQDNTVVFYGSCGEYFDYLQPKIKDLFPQLKVEYIDPKHDLSNYIDSSWAFLVRTPNSLNINRSDVIPKEPVMFDVKELVMD